MKKLQRNCKDTAKKPQRNCKETAETARKLQRNRKEAEKKLQRNHKQTENKSEISKEISSSFLKQTAKTFIISTVISSFFAKLLF